MVIDNEAIETTIQDKEKLLRDWFTQGSDPIAKVIDSLDIGWGGVQRWATRRMPPVQGLHLDIACGYATFLAQLGWRFPKATLVGLNIDFAGPHKLARPLLKEAGVQVALVQADARHMPFSNETFHSVSCFLGLQDIEIGFGEEGVKETLTDAIRVLQPRGSLILLDEFPYSRFAHLLSGLSVEVIHLAERPLDVHWTPDVAERAIELYAEGWVAQARLKSEIEKKRIFEDTHRRLRLDMEQQLSEKGYYVPMKLVHLLMGRKIMGKFDETKRTKRNRGNCVNPQ